MAATLPPPGNIWPRSNSNWAKGVETGFILLLAVLLAAIVLTSFAPFIAVPLLGAFPIVPLVAMIRSPSAVRTNKSYLRQWRLIGWSFFAIAIANGVPIFVEPDAFDTGRLLWLAALPATVLFAAYYAIASRIPLLSKAPRKGRSFTGVVAIASVLYGFALATNVNALGYTNSSAELRGVILAKKPKQGRGSNTITVAWLGAREARQKLPVSHGDFQRLQLGQNYCVTVREGYLGVRVYQPHACPPIGRSRPI